MKCLWCGEEVERAEPIIIVFSILGANRKCIYANCEASVMELNSIQLCLEWKMTKAVCPDCQKWHQQKKRYSKEYSLICLRRGGAEVYGVIQICGRYKRMTLVIKELRQELAISEEGLLFGSIAVIQCESKKKRIETIPTY